MDQFTIDATITEAIYGGLTFPRPGDFSDEHGNSYVWTLPGGHKLWWHGPALGRRGAGDWELTVRARKIEVRVPLGPTAPHQLLFAVALAEARGVKWW